MAALKEIKARIASVRSTLKITSAMKMVASAKLHRVQGQAQAAAQKRRHGFGKQRKTRSQQERKQDRQQKTAQKQGGK